MPQALQGDAAGAVVLPIDVFACVASALLLHRRKSGTSDTNNSNCCLSVATGVHKQAVNCQPHVTRQANDPVGVACLQAQPGAMAVLQSDAAAAHEALAAAGAGSAVVIANRNSPRQTVLSGSREGIRAVVDVLSTLPGAPKGISQSPKYALHTSQLFRVQSGYTSVGALDCAACMHQSIGHPNCIIEADNFRPQFRIQISVECAPFLS